MLKNRVPVIFVFLIVALIASACGGKPDMPAESVSQTMVKSTISDLADAANTGNFKVIRAKASLDFQQSVSEEKLVSTFQRYVDAKDTTVPLLRQAIGKDAKFSPAPTMREESGNYILVTIGSFAIDGAVFEQVKFNNEYVWRDGAWKLLKVSVDME